MRGGLAGEFGLEFGPDAERDGHDRPPSCGKSRSLPKPWKRVNLMPHYELYVAEPFRHLTVPVAKP